MADDRSQKATPKRRQDARKRGQVVRSRELTSALAVLAVVVLLGWQARYGVDTWRNLLSQMLDHKDAGDVRLLHVVVSSMGSVLLHSLALPFAVVWIVSLTSSVAQGGLVFSAEALQPRFTRLNPATNIKNIFSILGLSRMVKSLVPVGIIVMIAIAVTERDWTMIVNSSRASARSLTEWMSGRMYELAWKCGLVLLAWSAIDYVVQYRHLETSLRMTKQEVSQEAKNAEASPLIRGQIRKRRREMRKRWSMKDVERATAVVTNPQHFAVALEYRPNTMPAPIVVAKGMDEVALQIKEIAWWNNIPMVENPPLAQALFRATEVGEAIPAKLYTAVAEILAFIYRTQANLRNAARAATSGT